MTRTLSRDFITPALEVDAAMLKFYEKKWVELEKLEAERII
jgi:hypothetical protein